MVSSGKTFSPCSFSALVFSVDSKLKLADEFINKTVFFRYTIQRCNDGASLFTSALPKKMSTNKDSKIEKHQGGLYAALTETLEGRRYQRAR
jgi:hypothetical protein